MSSGAVQLVADGEVRVGDVTYPGGLLPDGRATLLGVTVRRLRLAERDRLVSLVAGLVTGADEARTLAGLVLAAAAAPGDALPTHDDDLAAVQAVALHLAGAALDGPLARTRLLAGRSAGAAADDLPAADADLLAAELARAVVVDDGWTRLVLDGSDSGDGPPRAVRDRLAAALLARASQPLDPSLARALLGGSEGVEDGAPPQWAVRASDPWWSDGGSPAAGAADAATGDAPAWTSGTAGAASGPGPSGDSSAASGTSGTGAGVGRSPQPLPEGPGVARHGALVGHDAAGPVALRAAPGDAAALARATVSAPRGVASGPAGSWRPSVGPAATAPAAAPRRGAERSGGVDRWGAPVTSSGAGATSALLGAAGGAWPLPTHPAWTSCAPGALVTGARSALHHTDRDAVTDAPTAAPRVPSDREPATSTGADDLARELQRAADLRGLRR
ncbi:hypothetical protein [Cellulomonas persica]|uniref:Uncharacterized protein n=1 Tax=Cellulomonas persica TaxID=76861 RepID=A0A510UT02_9CELL|nr:hypothetical protein [Cellulomonas persica]GEK17719.1 hypothetical protein CPE01_14520 [Cellulomonas persica]